MLMDDRRVRAFFEQYARGRTMWNVDLIASLYADPFMVADQHFWPDNCPATAPRPRMDF